MVTVCFCFTRHWTCLAIFLFWKHIFFFSYCFLSFHSKFALWLKSQTRFPHMQMLLYVYPVQMDQLMLISANPLRSTLRTTLSCYSVAEMDSGREGTKMVNGDINGAKYYNLNRWLTHTDTHASPHTSGHLTVSAFAQTRTHEERESERGKSLGAVVLMKQC